MPELPDITVVILTYNRYDEIKQTMAALRKHLVYPGSRLHWLIADDASPGDYVARLKRLNDFKGVAWLVNETNAGWGATVNRALNSVNTPLVFFTEDDYVLTEPLDLCIGAALLMSKPHLGYLHYYGTAGQHVVLHQFEADVAAYLPGFQDALSLPGKLTYLQLDGNSPSPYIYSNRPHLVSQAFHDYYGLYDEGRRLGETEEAYAVRVKGAMQADPTNAPGIAVLPAYITPKFNHIGRSYQHTEADRAR